MARSFESLAPALSAATLGCIGNDFGFTTMTPVQAAAIPLMLDHKDVVAEAVTGSGKTLAFAASAVELVTRAPAARGPRCIAVAPTRELAGQTFRVFGRLCAATNLTCALCVGGEDVEESVDAAIVVGTPGRLDDLTKRGALDGRAVVLLVLDEADTLLELGFAEELERLMRSLPKQRRTALFSATMTRAVADLARAGLRNPASVRVRVGAESTDGTRTVLPSELVNEVVVLDESLKLAYLMRILREPAARKTLVYFATCAAVDFFGRALKAAAMDRTNLPDIEGLHGKMVPKKRRATWLAFRTATATAERRCLLCTDVAARGLDVDDVDLVVQFDAPQKPETFVHRVGRTARAGRTGRAVILLADHEDAYVELLALRGARPALAVAPDDLAPDAAALRRALVDGCVGDRALLEKGTSAFTAAVRAYSEHRLPFIFRWEKVDVAALARLYALIKLPEMPELRKLAKKGKAVAFDREDVRTSTIPYADAKREAARQKRLVTDRADRVEKKAAILAALAKGEEAPSDRGFKAKKKREDAPRKRKGQHERIMDDWDDLAAEERLEKRRRKGKITQAEYDAELADLDGDGGDDSDFNGAHQSKKNARKQKGIAKKKNRAYKKSRG